MSTSSLTVALAQISPVWLTRDATLEKMVRYVNDAARQNCQLVVFGEALLPGYPWWLEHTGGATFNSDLQKSLYAHYASQSVIIEEGHLQPLCDAARKGNIAIYAGVMERAANRGAHSLYCSLVYIDQAGNIQSVHRKLRPTYEERLVWAPGDGHGLRVHKLGPFTVGGLNCWENWMPLPRAALHGMGENLHVAVWPGSVGLTENITRFAAREGRSYVLSVSGLLRNNDIPDHLPHAELLREKLPEVLANGGSCIAGPDGEWVIPPCANEETLLVATIDLTRVLEERQNFDPAGHYSRPDVTQLSVDRTRQSTIQLND